MHRQNSSQIKIQFNSVYANLSHSRFTLSPSRCASLLFLFSLFSSYGTFDPLTNDEKIFVLLCFVLRQNFCPISKNRRVLKNGQKPMLICLSVCLLLGWLLKLCTNNNNNIESDDDDGSYDNDNEK